MKYPASSPAALSKISFSHVGVGWNISRNVLSCNLPDFSPTSIHSLVPSRCTNCQCPIKRMHWMQCFQEGYSIVPRTGLIFMPGSCNHRSIQQPYLEQFVNFLCLGKAISTELLSLQLLCPMSHRKPISNLQNS